MKLRAIALVVILTLFGTAAQAGPITFDSHPTDFGTPIFDSGFTFTFQAAGWGVFGPGSGACCSINYNGTPALYADGDRDGARASSVMSLTGGGTFSVFGFDAASYWQGAKGTLVVIGSLSGGGTISASFGVNSTFQTFTLGGFTNLVSLTFQDSQSGAFLGAPGFGIDNIALEPSSTGVPDPGASLLLLGMGLVGLRAWQKRLH
jgi:hypothetical protein